MGLKNILDAGLIIAGMKRNQWKGREELESIQERRLLETLKDARENVPHFSKAPESARVRSLGDLADLPIMEKDEIRASPLSFISRRCDAGSLHKMSTGGTTGVPITLYFDESEGVFGSALRYHVLTECGFGPSDRLAALTHSKFVTTQIQRFIYRISAIAPSERPEKMLSALKAMRPSMLFAYPSILSILAGINREADAPLRFPKAVSSSEMLTGRARALISDSFGCGIRNYYGSNESWALAWECGRGSMHVNSDSVILEVVGRDGRAVREGEKGEVLITSLWRHSMPFIRYRLGDIAALGGKCACGRGLHVIRSLEGRSVQLITLPSGKGAAWSQVAQQLSNIHGLLGYQVIQESREALRVLAIPDAGRPCGKAEIIRLFHAILPERMDVEVEFVDDIPRSASGKMREFVSKLRPQAPQP